MHMQLQQKTEETEALATENKELQSVVAGYKKALEEVERAQRDVEAKHLAEIENLRAVHSLELSNLQARHRQKLQEATLQNDEKLLSRRRESHFIRPATATTPQQENATADFLQYIDAFYSSTLHLTAQNKA
ncbi:WEE/WEE1 protein kinase [Phytophthora cinnamomi]|uniref:WEE/WEE1 protein kinase n=1 Tax=Phytophthora cinnamomi TaxID=4785 RepID=UPI0035599E8A|nr:WEE/WEE1 protein kinase [Phytophthora cinnamomi]